MAIFLGILYALQLLVALLLILIILMQRTASEGLGLAFGGGMGESFFGSRAGNVLIKITAYLAVFFIVNTLLIAKLQTVQGGSMVSQDAPVVVPGGDETVPAPITPSATEGEAGSAQPGAAPADSETSAPVEVPAPSGAPSSADISVDIPADGAVSVDTAPAEPAPAANAPEAAVSPVVDENAGAGADAPPAGDQSSDSDSGNSGQN
jgi:preprotein translocase subunit SecG